MKATAWCVCVCVKRSYAAACTQLPHTQVAQAVRTAARGEGREFGVGTPVVLLGVLVLVLVCIGRQHWGLVEVCGRQLHRR